MDTVMIIGKDGGDLSAVHQSYASFAQGNVRSAAANTQVDLAYAAVPGHNNCLGGVAWSYDGNPTDGRLWITVGAATVFDLDVTQGGPGFIPFSPPLESQGELVVHLAAAGAGVVGKLSVLGRWTRSRHR